MGNSMFLSGQRLDGQAFAVVLVAFFALTLAGVVGVARDEGAPPAPATVVATAATPVVALPSAGSPQ